jgi:cysteine desulfuration protein SufE
MTNEVQQAQDELVEEFQFFDDWMDRYQYLIDMGRKLPEFPDSDRTDENKIRGCQSQVWFVASKDDGRLIFRAISDAAIVSGLYCYAYTVAGNPGTYSIRRRIS